METNVAVYLANCLEKEWYACVVRDYRSYLEYLREASVRLASLARLTAALLSGSFPSFRVVTNNMMSLGSKMCEHREEKIRRRRRRTQDAMKRDKGQKKIMKVLVSESETLHRNPGHYVHLVCY